MAQDYYQVSKIINYKVDSWIMVCLAFNESDQRQ